MPEPDPPGTPIAIVLCEPQPGWQRDFRRAGQGLRAVLQDWAPRIDHIGSTSVPGLVAKPVIDIQVSVASPADVDDENHPSRQALQVLGYGLRSDNDDRRKRLFIRRGGPVDVNLHLRRCGCVSQQQSLLFRDYLRVDAASREQYADEKRRLARHRWSSVDDYAQAKSDVVWDILRRADRWSWNGWAPGPTDV
jgi:GrpB-like predicted nucleotidyltransferase (UPF0157 family)